MYQRINYRMIRSLFLFLLLSCVGVEAQPVFSYILPDIGAPGMAVYFEAVGPNNGMDSTVFSVTDTILSNNPGNGVRFECVRAADKAKITFSPIVISWNGRLLSCIAFISPTCSPNSSDWRLLSDAWRIPIRFSNPTGSSIDTFYIVQPTHLGDLTSVTETIIGQGSLGVRSRRGAMIVDSMILNTIYYKVSTQDPDGIASNGNQGYLPFVLMSQGPIRGSGTGSGFNLTAPGIDAAPGGGGGGGQFCDNVGATTHAGTNGGNGYTGGGRGGRNGSSGAPNGYNSYGIGTGPPGANNSGNALNSNKGSLVTAAYESAGGGTGHPFGQSGEACTQGNGCAPTGWYGGASGEIDALPGAGGGYGTSGGSTNSSSDNRGRAHGNVMCIPIAGGSGGSSGNPKGISVCGGYGGGGGGALRLVAPVITRLSIGAAGAVGSLVSGGIGSNPVGGSGSGGHVGIHTSISAQSISIQATGGVHAFGTGTGGEGRVRIDGRQGGGISSTPSSAYTGPTIDTITSVVSPFTLRGTGAAGTSISLYMRTENTPWTVATVLTVATDGSWTYPVVYGGADSYLYFVAAQEVPNPSKANYLLEPSFVLSPTGAAQVKIKRIAQLICDPTRNMGTISCSQLGTKLDTFMVRNVGTVPVTLDSGLFATGTIGFTVEDPKPFKNISIKANDSMRVIVRFRQPANVYGVITDRLLMYFPTGTVPNVLTVDYSAKVDTVGLAVVDPATNTEYRNGFAIHFDHVCASVGASQTWALKNISKGPIKILGFSILGTKGVFNASVSKMSLNAGDSTHFTVNVPPHSKGTYYDTLSVIIDSCGIAYRFPVQARIVETEVFGYTTVLEDFSFVKVGRSLTHRFVIRNDGSGQDSASFQTVPTLAPPFSLQMIAPDTVPRVLGPGDSIVFMVTFTPDSARFYQQSLSWKTEMVGTSCPATVLFNPHGWGTNSSLVPSRATIDFGTQFQCGRKRDTVWIYNSGSTAAKVYRPATISGADLQRFKIITQPAADSTTLRGPSDSVMYVVEFNGDPADQTTSAKSATLNIPCFDDSAHTIQIQLTAIQTKAKLAVGNLLPIIDNNHFVNSAGSVVISLSNPFDSVFCISNVKSQHEPDILPAIRQFQMNPHATNGISITITPRSLTDINDTVTIYLSCPCVDSIKIPIIVHPSNNSLTVSPGVIDFDTLSPCERANAITLTIKNIDATAKANIDTVMLVGPDARVFKMNLSWTTYPYIIQPNFTDNTAISVGYNGSGTPAGLKTATVIIRYSINGQSIWDTIPVRAVRIVPLHTDSTTSMEFGAIKQGQVSTLPLSVTNDYPQQLDISFSFASNSAGAFKPNPSILPIPGKQTDTVHIEFAKDSTAEFRDTLYIVYFQRNLGCTDSIPILLHGQILPGLNFQVWLDRLVTMKPTDKDVKLALWAKTDSLKVPLTNLQFTATVELPSDMFFPKFIDGRGARILTNSPQPGNRRSIQFSVDTLLQSVGSDSTVLAYIVGDAMLGAQICDSTRITNFNWTNSGVRPTTWINKAKGDGQLCEEVCNAGGNRLLGGNGTPLSLSVSPNPTEHTATLQIFCVEKGQYSVSIVNATGGQMSEYHFDASANSIINLQQDCSALSSGVYQVRVQSPTQLATQPLLILK